MSLSLRRYILDQLYYRLRDEYRATYANVVFNLAEEPVELRICSPTVVQSNVTVEVELFNNTTVILPVYNIYSATVVTVKVDYCELTVAPATNYCPVELAKITGLDIPDGIATTFISNKQVMKVGNRNQIVNFFYKHTRKLAYGFTVNISIDTSTKEDYTIVEYDTSNAIVSQPSPDIDPAAVMFDLYGKNIVNIVYAHPEGEHVPYICGVTPQFARLGEAVVNESGYIVGLAAAQISITNDDTTTEVLYCVKHVKLTSSECNIIFTDHHLNHEVAPECIDTIMQWYPAEQLPNNCELIKFLLETADGLMLTHQVHNFLNAYASAPAWKVPENLWNLNALKIINFWYAGNITKYIAHNILYKRVQCMMSAAIEEFSGTTHSGGISSMHIRHYTPAFAKSYGRWFEEYCEATMPLLYTHSTACIPTRTPATEAVKTVTYKVPKNAYNQEIMDYWLVHNNVEYWGTCLNLQPFGIWTSMDICNCITTQFSFISTGVMITLYYRRRNGDFSGIDGRCIIYDNKFQLYWNCNGRYSYDRHISFTHGVSCRNDKCMCEKTSHSVFTTISMIYNIRKFGDLIYTG